jgi:hypothetical protein
MVSGRRRTGLGRMSLVAAARLRLRRTAAALRLWRRMSAALLRLRLTSLGRSVMSATAMPATRSARALPLSAAPVMVAVVVAARRMTVARTLIPLTRSRTAVVAACAADIYARLNDRRAISGALIVISAGVGWRSGVTLRIGWRTRVAARIGGRAVRVDGASCHQGGRGDDDAGDCEFHDGK